DVADGNAASARELEEEPVLAGREDGAEERAEREADVGEGADGEEDDSRDDPGRDADPEVLPHERPGAAEAALDVEGEVARAELRGECVRVDRGRGGRRGEGRRG